jgi:hypothetical protein
MINIEEKNTGPQCVNTRADVCLFVFLALQPIVVVLSQPGSGLLASSFSRFLDHTQRVTAGRTPLDE